MKRLLSVLLCICMVMTLIPGVGAEIAGDGSENNPYLISSVADLQAFAANVNSGTSYSGKFVKLTASLDLTGVEWTPIGKSGYEFEGTFDGGYHIITGLSIDTQNRYVGLFGKLENATVKKLGIENAEIIAGDSDVAILAGNAQGGLIENCYVTGSVVGSAGVGGILGSTHSSEYETTIKNCYARVALDNTNAWTADWAGISGWNNAASVKIINCYSACIGEIRPIAGWSDGSSVSNDQFVNTYFDKSLSPDFSQEAGRVDLGKTADELKTQTTFADWDFTDIWAIDPDINGGYPYLQGFDGVALSGAPGTLTVILTDTNDDPVTDATVVATADSGDITLVHQGEGIYSASVPNESATYTISVNGDDVGTVDHNGQEAKETAFEIEASVALSGTTYEYAYDCQRSPAFPSEMGDEITLRWFDVPLKREGGDYISSEGTWTLTEVGPYSGFDPEDYPNLDDIVEYLAEYIYGLEAGSGEDFLIHKLVDENDTLVGYGVLVGVDETNGYAFFVGDALGGSGAGYILSKTEITEEEIIFTTEQMAQSTSIAVSDTEISFADEEEGYSAPAAKTITVTNNGDTATAALTVTLSGDTDAFTLSADTIAAIEAGNNAEFTVAPAEGLSEGTYEATITIKNSEIMPLTISVSFSVIAGEEGEEGEQPTGKKHYGGLQAGGDTSRTGADNLGLQYKDEEKPESEQKPVVKPDDGVCDGSAADNCPAVKFADLNTSAWYHADVDYAISKGLFNGTSNTAFSPNGKLTRAMLVAVLYRAEGSPATNKSIPFADVDMGACYANAVIWAQQNRIVTGVSETNFAPDEYITREQIATILFRYASYKGRNVDVNDEALSFADAASVSDYALAAMTWNIKNGFVQGRSGNMLAPRESATRAEAAALLHRFLEAK
ncbi:MAG: S-layer homology domain-containing protein [Oscillospiraceae bacterium]|nr:S-layer homology domain-containing protein [Oscillospiraceae bacterium]